MSWGQIKWNLELAMHANSSWVFVTLFFPNVSQFVLNAAFPRLISTGKTETSRSLVQWWWGITSQCRSAQSICPGKESDDGLKIFYKFYSVHFCVHARVLLREAEKADFQVLSVNDLWSCSKLNFYL